MVEEEKAQGPGKLEVPTLLVKPTGLLAGHTLRMRFPSTRYWIAHERGETSQAMFWAEALDAIEEHDLGRDPGSLQPSYIIELVEAWVAALKEAAVPPPTGSS